MLISLSGLDGCGKSTVARELERVLAAEFGAPTNITWCKYGVHPLSDLRLSRFFPTGRKGPTARRTRLPASLVAKAARRAYASALLVFYYALLYVRVIRPLTSGTIVICDRYVLDTFVDLVEEFGVSDNVAFRLCGAKWAPRPQVGVFLQISPAVAFHRKPDSRSLDYLVGRESAYQRVLRSFDAYEVSAIRPVAEIVEELTRAIRSGRESAHGC